MEEQVRAKLREYKADKNTLELVKATRILLLVGISGAGKDTIKRRLLERGSYYHLVSHTTRPPRVNHGILEKDGVDYHFINLDEAGQMLDGGDFVEAKIYSGNLYGTSIAEIKAAHDANLIATTDLEVKGVVEYKQISDRVVAVFLLPPSYKIWKNRLERRYAGGEIDEADMTKRMKTAVVELEHALNTPYFHFFINDQLDETVAQVEAIMSEHETPQREREAESLARDLLEQLKTTT